MGGESATGGQGEGGGVATGGQNTGGQNTGGQNTGGQNTGGQNTGGQSTGAAGAAGATGTGGLATGGAPPAGTPLEERLVVVDVTIGQGVKQGVQNWRVWGRGDLEVAPVFTVPRTDCSTLVCYTTDAGGALTARVAHLGLGGELIEEWTLATARECRGLAAAPDGSFAALLWDDAGDDIYLHRYDAAGTELGSTQLVNADNNPDAFGLGDSRLEYGDGRYGAYYHVHSDSGHEGDTLKWVDAATGEESTGWSWGCSHSMSNLLRYNAAIDTFMPACVTDCYPGTSGDFETESIGGIYLNHDDSKVLDVDAGCNGDVAGELGGAALAPDGFKLVFNAHQAPVTPGQGSYDESSMNQDIGFSSVAGDLEAGAVVWLTSTPDIDEADASIAGWQPADDPAEQYVVGWFEPPSTYFLARVDPSGNFIEGPTDVSSLVAWGHRDDPFRVAPNGDVVWAWFDGAGSTTLHLARLTSGGSAACTPY